MATRPQQQPALFPMMILRRDNFAKHFRARRCEWLQAFIALGLGIAYLSTPGLFGRSDLFVIMRAMADQATWGVVVIGVASLRLLMLWINGSWHVSPYFRAAGAFLCAGLWFLLFVSQSLSASPPQTRWAWLVLLIFDVLNAGDAAQDAGAVSASRGQAGAGR